MPQSPPLEATGEHMPIGAASVDNPSAVTNVVLDANQRKEHFQDALNTEKSGSQDTTALAQEKVRIMGESMADKFDKRD